MTYVLETTTPEDQKKILDDLDSDQSKKRSVIADRLFASGGRINWAIDKKRNSYIFIAPPSREQPLDPRFYFLHKGNWYELWVKAMFENEVHFDDPEPNEKEERQEFRENLKAALFAIGRYSEGSLDLLHSIFAEFKDRS
jgi:hypothetical protein